MNICFISNGLGLGGVEHMVTFLGNQMSKRKNNIYYYLLTRVPIYWNIYDGNHIFYRSDSKISKKHLFITRINKIFDLIKNRGIFSAIKYQEDIIEDVVKLIKYSQIDILFVTSAQQIALIPSLKEKCPTVKIVAWIHQSSNSIEKLSRCFYPEFIEGLREANCIVCLTLSAKQYFSKINKHTLVIHNPILINSEGVSNLDNQNISFVSRIDFSQDQKGLYLLRNIARQLPSYVNINIAGGGTKKNEKKFKRIIKSKKISNKIFWNGVKKGNSLKDFYLQSSLFISTSRTESFGLSTLEAMSFGIPVISFKTEGACEILDNGIYGILIDNYDTIKFAQCIIKLLNNKNELLKYQQLSLKRSELFTQKKIIGKWVDLLGNIK